MNFCCWFASICSSFAITLSSKLFVWSVLPIIVVSNFTISSWLPAPCAINFSTSAIKLSNCPPTLCWLSITIFNNSTTWAWFTWPFSINLTINAIIVLWLSIPKSWFWRTFFNKPIISSFWVLLTSICANKVSNWAINTSICCAVLAWFERICANASEISAPIWLNRSSIAFNLSKITCSPTKIPLSCPIWIFWLVIIAARQAWTLHPNCANWSERPWIILIIAWALAFWLPSITSSFSITCWINAVICSAVSSWLARISSKYWLKDTPRADNCSPTSVNLANNSSNLANISVSCSICTFWLARICCNILLTLTPISANCPLKPWIASKILFIISCWFSSIWLSLFKIAANWSDEYSWLIKICCKNPVMFSPISSNLLRICINNSWLFWKNSKNASCWPYSNCIIVLSKLWVVELSLLNPSNNVWIKSKASFPSWFSANISARIDFNSFKRPINASLSMLKSTSTFTLTLKLLLLLISTFVLCGGNSSSIGCFLQLVKPTTAAAAKPTGHVVIAPTAIPKTAAKPNPPIVGFKPFSSFFASWGSPFLFSGVWGVNPSSFTSCTDESGTVFPSGLTSVGLTKFPFSSYNSTFSFAACAELASPADSPTCFFKLSNLKFKSSIPMLLLSYFCNIPTYTYIYV